MGCQRKGNSFTLHAGLASVWPANIKRTMYRSQQNDWRAYCTSRGSTSCESHLCHAVTQHCRYRNFSGVISNPENRPNSAQVHWLRVIVDEGHMIGNSLYMTNKLQMACALRAERRWLMTGTPTPGGPNSDTAHLQPLLAFLHNEPYGTEPSVWQV